MGVVNQPVKDAVGHGRIANLLVPACYRQLRRENQRVDLMAVLTNLPEVPTLWFRQRCHGPIVDHQHINLAQSRQQIVETSVGACQRQIAKQRRRPCVERRIPIPAGFLRQRAVDKALPDAGRPENK
jgi:hypothetical protein